MTMKDEATKPETAKPKKLSLKKETISDLNPKDAQADQVEGGFRKTAGGSNYPPC
jgi:hypothetical protein